MGCSGRGISLYWVHRDLNLTASSPYRKPATRAPALPSSFLRKGLQAGVMGQIMLSKQPFPPRSVD